MDEILTKTLPIIITGTDSIITETEQTHKP